MNRILAGLEPEAVFYYFEEISRIPRGTGNEKEISDYLVAFARGRGLEVIQDQVLNVIIKKPASAGYEHVPTVIVQGHMDMVCEKNKITEHDFTKDPIFLSVRDDMIHASGTTLGADNGIAVAFILALLSSDEAQHPAVEALLTVGEEGSMVGVNNLDPDNLSGRLLINMDAEKEGRLLVSSAGGASVKLVIDSKLEPPRRWQESYLLSVGGLRGGHSGSDINKNRANANKLMGRILYELAEEFNYQLCRVQGGTKANAITREAEALILIDPSQKAMLEERVLLWDQIFKKENSLCDPQVFVRAEMCRDTGSPVFTEEAKMKLIHCLQLIPSGVQSMSPHIDRLVQSSTNLGIIKADESETVFTIDIRSSEKSVKEDILNRFKCLSKAMKCVLFIRSDYPEWPYAPDSELRSLFRKVYSEQYGKELELKAIHAGLECGVMAVKLPGLDIVSIGPDVYDAHTPYEHLNIPSAGRTYEFLLAVLRETKNHDWEHKDDYSSQR